MRKSICSWPLSALAAATLVACGGGSDDTSPPVVPAAAKLQGTAAIGAAVALADVAVTNTTGNSVCTEAAIRTNAAGEFSCTLAEGMAAPFILLVTDPSGGVAPMVSVGSVTPAAGTVGVVNVTPLTTAMVGQLSADDSALTVVADRSLLDTVKLDLIKAKVRAQLAPVLAALGAPTDFDPFSTPLAAATPDSAGNIADQVVEALRITSVGGQIVIAPVDQPDAAVAMADASTANPALVSAPAAKPADIQAGLRRMAQALNACFALPVNQRVRAKDDSIPLFAGGPEVIEADDACDGIVDGDGFLHGGYRGGQFFYGLINDTAMVGATFATPEVMLLLPDAGGPGAHRAIVNLRYRDANGTAGSLITIARRLAQDEPDVGAFGDWRLYGDQQRVNTSIQPIVVRREQLAPNAGTGTGPFGGAASSRFETGLNLFVNKDGPGSAGLRAARVKGPGLPTAGVVLTPLDPSLCANQNWMNVRRKDGLTDPASATPSGTNGNRFFMQRTVGLTGSEATTRRGNPFEGSGNNTQFPNWAHPLDYGKAAGSSDYIDFGQLRAMTAYSIELYYNGEEAPRYTYQKRIITPVVPAVSAVVQQWVQLDTATRRLLDPTDMLAGAATSFDLSWLANPLAETVASAGVYTGAGGVAVNQGAVAVVRGETDATALAPSTAACAAGAQFTALTGDGTSYRQIQLRLRTMDGSSKDTFTHFN